jgi:hypothetical protein
VAAASLTQARADSARRRRDDLEHGAVPLLRRIADAEPTAGTWPELSRSALALERQVRDDLRARELLDDSVRTALRAARARGAVVDVVDDRGSGPQGPGGGTAAFVGQLRAVLAPVLDACGASQVTVRLSPGGGWATLSVDGPAPEAGAVREVLHRARLRGPALDVRDDLHVEGGTGSLWVEFRPAGTG